MTQIIQAVPLNIEYSPALRYLPEGPMALSDHKVSWVAIQHGTESKHGSLNVLDLKTMFNQSYELPGRPGFAFPTSNADVFIIGCERSIGLFNLADRSWTLLYEGVDAAVDNTIINDGWAIGNQLIFGTKDLEFATKKAGLYLYQGSSNHLVQLRSDQICSNGKAILTDDDGKTHLLDIDSPTRKVVSYPIDLETGELGAARVVIDFTDDPAVPDGAVLTPDGTGLVVSMFRPEVAEHGETRLYDLRTGERKIVWQTKGSPQNTCPAFVRVDGDLKLLITTAVEHMNEEAQTQCPNAGKLFLADTNLHDPGHDLTARYTL
ncbi:SMP-30/gluconolactonase/LRE family protein [Rubripirellula sp.]|jgi:sugar lactone lactonase YvrE|nr:SMP-30/gluconolactonase/LRE family protein [Rubripirellula sp.]MDA9840342.1 SMP-30/gluconolactonase/LRE family protein [Rubripirellula sp.]